MCIHAQTEYSMLLADLSGGLRSARLAASQSLWPIMRICRLHKKTNGYKSGIVAYVHASTSQD